MYSPPAIAARAAVPARIAAGPVEWKELIGIQYALRGEKGPLGLNCYGLVREVYERLRIELPARDGEALDQELVQREGANWIRLDGPQPYAVALLRMPSGYHLGVVTPELALLHALPSRGVVLSRLSRYRGYVVGFYAYRLRGGEALPDAGGPVGRAIGGMLISIAAFALAPMTMGASLAGWGALSGWALAGAVGASMAITMAGNMLVNALMPLPSEELAISGFTGDLASSTTYGWNGMSNAAQQGLVKPWIFGRIKAAGQVISEKTWYDPQEREYLDMLLCPCAHRITRMDDIRLNDTGYLYYGDVVAETRPGDDEQTMIDMFGAIHVQYSSGARLPYDASEGAPAAATFFASKARITGARLTVVAPQGLCEFTGGAFAARSVAFRIQYRRFSESTWRFVPGDGVVGPGGITETNGGFSGRITWGFDTSGATTYIAFTLNSYWTIDGSTHFAYSGYRVHYRKLGDTAWTLHNSYAFGTPAGDPFNQPNANGSASVVINNLPLANYQVRVDWYTDWCTNLYGTHNRNAFAITAVAMASQGDEFTISGDSAAPTDAVSRTAVITGLDEDYYLFRLWRRTVDHETESWRDDVWLRTYAEIVDAGCAYPNHALVGVRAMATDRLSGSRPKITAIVTGPPLSVPPAVDRADTTVHADDGLVTGSGNEVGEVIVDGLRKIRVNAALLEMNGVPGTCCWLVFMASPGYASPDRPLTKHYVRVEAWEATDGGTRTRLYVRMSESVAAGSVVMVFHEGVAPTRNTAWAVALMLLQGSQGRIAISEEHWPCWAEWNAWNEELVWNQAALRWEPRHQFDAVVDFESDLWSAAFRAAATARAALAASGGSYRPVIDRATTETQVFSEGNSANCRVEMIPGKDRPNILVTTFLDEDANYEQRTVSEEDVRDGESPIMRTVPTQVGVCRESQVRRLLRYMLAQNRHITHTISFDAGLDAIECEVGDTFLSQSSAKDLALSGRVREVRDGMVVLDRAFTPEAGETYRLSIWGGEGIRTWQGPLAGAELREVPAPAGFVMAGMYEYPYMLTKLTAERTKYRLLGVKRPVLTMHSELAAIEYRPEVYAND